jgi:formylglycine-generating enzyme required for sulfatase activity
MARCRLLPLLLASSLIVLLPGCREKVLPGYWKLVEEGSAKLTAGDNQGALQVFEQAAQAYPSQLGIHDRIARLALNLGQKERGLQAIEAMLKINPALAGDADIVAVKAQLEALGGTAPAVNVEPQVALAIRTAELELKDATAAYQRNDEEKVQQHTQKARESLLPVLLEKGRDSLPAWMLGARLALLLEDNHLAAAALVAIERLEPGFARQPALLDLMAELNRRPLKPLLAEARAKPEEFLRGAASGPRSGAPFLNSLQMKFVPVPGTDVMFCIWETRKGDYAAYTRANAGVDNSWQNVEFKGVPVSAADDHPVVNVSWNDARAFCEWLTQKEQRENKLSREAFYRLPTDEEWSKAVGLASEAGSTPKDRDAEIPDVYPWGTQWPPPPRAGNYADQTMKARFTDWDAIQGYRDGFATTAPAGSFAANKLGLYDMGGNVWEWCEDWYDGEQKWRVLRGASWSSNDRDNLLSSARSDLTPESRSNNIGFRVVLVGVSAR